MIFKRITQIPTVISVFVLYNLLAGIAATGQVIEKWQVIDIPFSVKQESAHPFEEAFGAVFTHEKGTSLRIPGFYNGDKEWVLRFCPPEEGVWEYLVFSSLSELAGKKGQVRVKPNTRVWQKGPIRISEDNPQQFTYADGSPYFLLAFELDWLFALDAENPEDIPLTRNLVRDVANHGFNQIVMNVFAYDAGWGQRDKARPEHLFAKPRVFPFGGDNLNPDFSTLDVEFFKRLDRVIAHLDQQQIVAHLMIYVWNKKVSWPEPESIADNRYFDYVVKRYQAYPNLIWDISKEALAYGRDDMGYISRRIERLRRLDGHGRLLSVHDYNYCDAYPDKVDFISIQEWEPYLYYRMRQVREKHVNKPIFNIEHGGYEKTTYSIFDGAYTDPVTCLDRNYQCVFAGVYSTYYWQNTSWYNVITEPFSLLENEQPHFQYYRNLMKLFEEFNYNELYPLQPAFSAPCLTNGTDTYLYYLPDYRRGIFGTMPEFKAKRASIRFFDPLTGEFHDGGETEISTGSWLQIIRPDSITGPPAVVILQAVDPQ